MAVIRTTTILGKEAIFYKGYTLQIVKITKHFKILIKILEN